MPRLLSLGLIAAFALAATACGANPATSDDVADAGERTKAAGTFRHETVTRDSGSSDETSEFRTTGVVDPAHDRSEYREESTGCRVITIGDVSYSEYAPEDGLPAGKRWVKFEYDAADTEALYEQSLEPVAGEADLMSEGRMTDYSVAFSTSGPEGPAEYLDYLRESSGEPERVGEEDVRGVSTTRYHATIDVRSSTRKAFEAAGWKARNIERFLENVQGVREIDVWVDSDGLARRIVHEGSAAEWQTTTEFFDFGLEVEIQPPPAAEVMEPVEWQRIAKQDMKEQMDEMDEYLDEIDEGSTALPGAFEPEMSSGGGSEEPASCLH